MESKEEQAERLSKINIREMYGDALNSYDIVCHKEVWHLYNKEKPAEGEFISVKEGMFAMIKNVTDDGIAYFINLVKNDQNPNS